MTSVLLNLDNIGVAVRNIQESEHFYCQVLGLQLAERDSDAKTISVHAGSMTLFLFETGVPDAPVRTSDYSSNPLGLDHLSFRVEDVDKTYSELTSAGIEFFLPPEDAEWGARVCGCKDPSGTLLYFLKWRE